MVSKPEEEKIAQYSQKTKKQTQPNANQQETITEIISYTIELKTKAWVEK